MTIFPEPKKIPPFYVARTLGPQELPRVTMETPQGSYVLFEMDEPRTQQQLKNMHVLADALSRAWDERKLSQEEARAVQLALIDSSKLEYSLAAETGTQAPKSAPRNAALGVVEDDAKVAEYYGIDLGRRK